MWKSDGISIGWRQWRKNRRQLTTTGSVQALDQPPVPAEGQDKVLGVGQSLGPVSENHTNEEVFIDDDHGAGDDGRLVVVGVVSAEDRIVHEIGVESGLELVGEVAGRDASQDGSAGFGHAGISRSAPATPLFGDVDGGHAIHCAARVFVSDLDMPASPLRRK